MRVNIYIDGQPVDLNEEVNLSFTYSIADIREPETRKASFSKTIFLPASKNNNNLFTQIFEVNKALQPLADTTKFNFNPDFNPNRKATTLVTVEGFIVMLGYMQMLKVRKQDGMALGYEVIIISETKNIIDEFGDDKLCSLDFSKYAHPYNPQVTIPSWDDFIVIDGQQETNFIAGVPMGRGYIYPSNCKYFKNPTTDSIGNSQNDLPAIYLKEYIDSIFEKYGYSYQSDFFNTDYFKSLVIPASKYSQVLNQSEIDELQFFVSEGSVTPNQFVKTIGSYQERVNVLFGDVFNNQLYNTSTGYYKATAGWNGTFTANLEWNGLISINYGSNTQVDDFDLQVTVRHRLMRKRGGNFTELDSTNTVFNLQLLYPSPTSATTLNFAAKSAVNSFEHTLSYTGNILANDEYYIETAVLLGGDLYDGTTPLDWFFYLDYEGASRDVSYVNEFFNTVDNDALGSNATVDIGRFINTEITVRDFFLSVIKLFNLYLEPDKQNDKRFYIEPYQTYYNRLNKKDWTNKIDLSEVEIIPTSGLDIRNYQFKFIDDTDIVNKAYKEKYLDNYGDFQYTNDNSDFNTNEKVIQPLFAPTPLSTQFDLYKYENIFFDEKESERNIKLRILIYGGVRDDGGGNYCYVGEVDNPLSPNEALRYDHSPSELYYYSDTLTNRTLFNKFWSAYVKEVTDPNSKMVVAKFRLTPLDIANFRFNDEIFVIDEYFRVNQIIDYNPQQDGLTKVELIKVNFSEGYTPKQYRTVGAVTSFNVVQGGEDEIRDAGAVSFYNVLQGGEDEIRDVGATTNIGIVNGGQNTV